MIKTGDKAINFSLKDKDENTVSLDDFKGKWVVLYFYPKDNTSGCTLEAKEFSELISDFSNLNAVVIGISPDSPKKHQNFILKHELKVILLSDEEHEVIEKYGQWVNKKLYGKEYMGVNRSTFIISPDGIVKEVWEKVKASGHAQQVNCKLKEL
jgi:peroxiredoxin Q/BCP